MKHIKNNFLFYSLATFCLSTQLFSVAHARIPVEPEVTPLKLTAQKII